MNEKLLQFIWQFQYFSAQNLQTTEGETLLIEKPGQWNHHQGPDFSEAVVRVGNTRWAGNIELHLCSSDWMKHGHLEDMRYHNIILHVVWEDDKPLHDRAGNYVATLELKDRIPGLLLERYRQMMETLVTVPCRSFLPVLDQLNWAAWKERLAAERLERKSGHILGLFRQANGHWEELTWWLLAANFGIRVNAGLFEWVARELPVTILARHRNHLQQLEALLLGQANLLSGCYQEAYPKKLQSEYKYLRKKYKLHQPAKQPAFLRMRPAAFPTVRLAQLAMLLHRNTALFAFILEANSVHQLVGHFMVTASDYWNYHYRFDEETAMKPKQLGRQMAENIVINTAIPLLFTYGLYTNDESLKQRALQWLYELPEEHNQITGNWQQSGISHRCALDSQALIELTNLYCMHKRCLECAVGNRILREGI